MTQCDICQVSNEDGALFCRECGGRLPGRDLSVPSPAATSSPAMDPTRPEPPKRPKLHSPILGGADSDFDDSYQEPAKPKSQSKTGGKKGLRSPLLGGDAGLDDDYDNEPQANFSKGGKGGLRSPMLGGGGKSSGKHDLEFPHRTHQDIEDEQSPGAGAGPNPTLKPHKGLRSPLLGGDDGDFEEMPGIGNAKPHGTSKAHRLRSPILGGGGGDEYLDEEVFDEDDIHEDPTALRSPLLAVRAPKTEKPKPAPEPPQSSVAAQSVVAPQPPVPQPAQQYEPAPVPPPMPSPAPVPLPSPSASQAQMPALPQVPPRFQPQPAPSPSSSHYQLSQQTLVNLTPAQQSEPDPLYQTPSQLLSQGGHSGGQISQYLPQGQAEPEERPAPSTQPVSKPSPQSTASASADTARPVLRSKLLGDDDALGQSDRRGSERRSGPRTGGRRSIDFSEESEPVYQPPQATPNAGAPLVMATAAFALLIKLWYVISFTQYLMSNPAAGLDQVASIAVLVGLIVFGMKASQRA